MDILFDRLQFLKGIVVTVYEAFNLVIQFSVFVTTLIFGLVGVIIALDKKSRKK